MIPLVRSLSLVALLLLLFAGRVLADATADVSHQEDRRIAAYLKSDTATLDTIFADDLVYVHSSGVADTKAKVIDSLKSGDVKILQYDREGQNVRVSGDTAIVTAIGHLQVTLKGKDVKIDLRSVCAYVKGSKGWQLVHYQGTRLPAPQ